MKVCKVHKIGSLGCMNKKLNKPAIMLCVSLNKSLFFIKSSDKLGVSHEELILEYSS